MTYSRYNFRFSHPLHGKCIHKFIKLFKKHSIHPCLSVRPPRQGVTGERRKERTNQTDRPEAISLFGRDSITQKDRDYGAKTEEQLGKLLEGVAKARRQG